MRNPDKSCSVGSLVQLEEKTKMDERTLSRKFQKGNVYIEPMGKFKVLRVLFTPDNRKSNGNTDNFKKKENVE